MATTKTASVPWRGKTPPPRPPNGWVVRWRGDLPAALRWPPATSVVLLPRWRAPEADTICSCGGLLTYTAGRWLHVDQCLSCCGRAGSCMWPHVGCTAAVPEPMICQHRSCLQPVTLADNCALDGARQVCCGCCLDRGE